MTNNRGLGSNPESASPDTLLSRVEYARTLWSMAFSDHNLAMPDDAYFIRALSKFSMAEFEYAVGRTARKFPVKQPRRPPFVTLNDLAGYVIGILNGERKDRGGPGA